MRNLQPRQRLHHPRKLPRIGKDLPSTVNSSGQDDPSQHRGPHDGRDGVVGDEVVASTFEGVRFGHGGVSLGLSLRVGRAVHCGRCGVVGYLGWSEVLRKTGLV